MSKTLIDIATEYCSYGLSVLPVKADKLPIGAWKKSIENIQTPSKTTFSRPDCAGIAIVCGSVSGNLECIDIDTKYDVSGTLYEDFKRLILASDRSILNDLVVERTPTGGYHFLYATDDKIDGNQKLANRETTNEEKSKNPKEKCKVLIETRGEGGYFMCHPSPGYELVYGDFSSIKKITKEQRQTILNCARTFNTYFENKPLLSTEKKIYDDNNSPFEDYNKRGDVLALLEEAGWKVVFNRGTKNLLLRPGGEGKWSADFDSQKRLFYVFTTSSEFESEKAYNPVQVLATIKFGGDFKEASKWLRQNGYGDEKQQLYNALPEKEIKADDDDMSFASSIAENNDYLDAVQNGTFKMGLPFGFPGWDDFYRLKEGTLTIVNGHDNVGKSVVLWYLATLSAKKYGWRWIIHAAENKTGGVYRKLMEFYACKPLKDFVGDERKNVSAWVDDHFTVLNNRDTYTYTNLLVIGEKLMKKKKYNAFLIDPYNSLYRPKSGHHFNVHDYDYEALGDMRTFINRNKCSIYINCHAQTEALRRTYHSSHEYAGMPMPPSKADTEGGGKFSNRADDFITIHRMTQHPERWMWTEIHVRKIKEMETGGRPTPHDEPLIIKMTNGGSGFEDENGCNPLIDSGKKYAEPKHNPNSFIEPLRTEIEDDPF